MKYLLIVLCLGLTLTASASERIVVPSLPDAVHSLAEVETNVVFSITSVLVALRFIGLHRMVSLSPLRTRSLQPLLLIRCRAGHRHSSR